MSTIPVRYLAELNPSVPEFDALSHDSTVGFLPLEAVWSDARADHGRTVTKAAVVSGYTRHRAGDVVVPKVTPTFQAARSMVATRLGAGTTELHVLRPRSGVDPRWICYATRSEPFLREGVTAFQGVAGLQRVPPEFVNSFRVADKSTEEQRRIADFLDDRVSCIDRIIAARRDQVKLVKSAQLEAVRVRTTIGRSHSTRPSGVDWMPTMGSDWQLWRIGQAFETGSGTTPKSDRPEYYDGDFPWVTTSDLRDRAIASVPRSVTDAALQDYSALRLFAPGTLLIAMYGATVGRLGQLEIPACVNQACCALIERGPVSADFAFYWLLVHRREIMGLASGGGQPNISQEIVRSLRVPTPPRSIQDDLVQELRQRQEQTNRVLTNQSRSIDLLVEYKSSLITAAVTGELDVTTAGSTIPGGIQ